MKNTMKKIICSVLTVLMLVSVVPMGVSASDRWDVINAKGVSGDDIVAQARTYLGVPYTNSTNHQIRTGYGSTMAFDCSGFAYRVCRDVGLTSSRANYSEGKDDNGNYYITADTRYQRYYGLDISYLIENVNKGDCTGLQAGDLLFFTGDNVNVSHVAIYSGNGTIIHSEGWEGCVAEHPINRYPTSDNWYFAACRLVEDKIETGDIIEFGSYPQTEEKDEAIINALNSLAPEWDKWTSYGYYSGDGNIGSMKQGDWMRYVDVPYGGATYRGVKFTKYRPFHTWKVVSESNTYQSANGYKTNTIYWFKFEPIKWKVLDPNTGLVLSELLIDSQAFNNEIYGNGNIYSTHYGDAEKKNKANKYETSSIRAWLNYDFYNTAFSDAEELKMLPYGNVADRVVLLSTSEVANSKYGFNVDGGAYDEARKGVGSDYAKSQGLYLYENGTNKGNSYWILRTAGDYSVHCKEVTYSCNITNDFGWNVATTNNGIRPAIVLKTLDINAPCQHPNATNVPQLDPNCIDIGFTAGTYCNDCATWLSGHEVIAVGDHKDSNGDRICDTCLVELSKPGGTEVVKKNFIQKAIDAVKNAINSVVNFFRRLLGI